MASTICTEFQIKPIFLWNDPVHQHLSLEKIQTGLNHSMVTHQIFKSHAIPSNLFIC